MSRQKTWNLEVVQETGLLLKLSLFHIMCFQMDNAQCTGNYFIYSVQKNLVYTYEKKKKKNQTCLSMCNITVFVINVNV